MHRYLNVLVTDDLCVIHTKYYLILVTFSASIKNAIEIDRTCMIIHLFTDYREVFVYSMVFIFVSM